MLSVKGHALGPAQVPGPVLAAIATAIKAALYLYPLRSNSYTLCACFRCKLFTSASANLAWIKVKDAAHSKPRRS